jgi:hypothetical protein
MSVVVVVAVVVAMAVAEPGVGAGFRVEASLKTFHAEPPLAQQAGQDAVLQEHQLVGVQLHRHMAVPEVVGRLQQRQGIPCAHTHHRLGCRLHQHQLMPVRSSEPFPGLESLATGELQQEIAAAGATAKAPQAGALIGRES